MFWVLIIERWWSLKRLGHDFCSSGHIMMTVDSFADICSWRQNIYSSVVLVKPIPGKIGIYRDPLLLNYLHP